MILTCPECATSYFVDDSKIGPDGREVRCASCSARWIARLEHGVEVDADFDENAPYEIWEPQPEPPPAPEPAAERRRAARSEATALPKAFREREQARKHVKAAAAAGVVWAAMAVMLLTLVGGAYVFRVDVVRLWPKTASAYAAVRAPVNPLGLEFEDVSATPALRYGRAALVVTGKIRNVKDAPIESPALNIQLLDKGGKQLAAKIADPENALIPPRETRNFSVDILDPPLATEDANVSFIVGRKASPKPQLAKNEHEDDMVLRGPVADQPVAAPPSAPIAEAKPLPSGSPHALPHD